MELDEIKGFLNVDHLVSTAGQPSESQIEILAKNGIEIVINLGLMDKRYCLENEQESVMLLGMKYIHIPVEFSNPTQSDFDQFVTAMEMFKNKKIFVHCAANYRATCFLALHYFASGIWNKNQAADFVKKIWTPDQTWQEFFDKQVALASTPA